MKFQRFLLDILSESPALQLSAAGGIIIPILDLFVGWRIREHAISILADWEPTGILFHLLLNPRLRSFLLELSLFKLCAVWQALLLLPPMGRYIRGKETDMGLIGSMSIVEFQLMFYFSPTIIVLLVRSLWSIRSLIAMVLIPLAEAYTTCPDGLGKKVANILLPILIPMLQKILRLHNRYDLNIRGLFMHVCETLLASFDRLEIAIGQWRRVQLYEYHKLQDPKKNIRLLILKRGWMFFCQPYFKLIETPLDKAPPFEAISYTWGPDAPSIPIKVDGALILVTAPIDELLWNRRSIFTSHVFWIDAICINQRDQEEKSTRVIVWLGAPQSRKDTRIVRKMIRALTGSESIVPTTAILENLFSDEKDAFIAVGKLFSHSWFERIWIVQEVAAGKKVHVMYHGICIEWEVLTAAAHRLGHNTELKTRLLRYNHEDLLKATAISAQKPRHGTSVNVLQLIHWPHLEFLNNIRHSTQIGTIVPLAFHLVATRVCKATDPRDKIFALLGIAEDGRKLPFTPNYKEDVDQVFLKTTAFVLSTKEWFMLLCMGGRGYDFWDGKERPELLDKLPSWVPVYDSDIAARRPPTTSSILSRDPAGKVTFCTSNEKIIQLQVFAFDKIEHLGPTAKAYNSLDHIPSLDAPMDAWIHENSLADWYISARQLARQKSSPYRSQELVDQQFWELCMNANEYIDAMGTVPTLYPPLSVEARRLFEYAFSSKEPESLKIPSTMEGLQEMAGMTMYLGRRFAFSTGGRAFCITATGHMSLVPPLAKNGDTIFYVRGGYIPMVFREKAPRVRRAELVGTCLVYGVQDVYYGPSWENWLLE
ncbi:Heterokaryon incompatibility protein (HET) domain containing protein [Hyaloscypha variabilis]